QLAAEVERAHEAERLADRQPLGAAQAAGGGEAGARRRELQGPPARGDGRGEQEDRGSLVKQIHLTAQPPSDAGTFPRLCGDSLPGPAASGSALLASARLRSAGTPQHV